MTPELIEAAREISRILDKDFRIQSARPLSGGDINEVYAIETTEGTKCLKLNSEKRFPGIFKAEFDGLKTLASSGSIKVANPVANGVAQGEGFLLLDYISSGLPKTNFWEDFGGQLANLHKQSNHSFGLNSNNYIGSLIQNNAEINDWDQFFYEYRIQPQVSLAIKKGFLEKTDVDTFERFRYHLKEIFPIEPPALLHGDLWNGNYMIDSAGDPVLIDPAIYYGHREMDLAMTKLFGGFDRKLYQSYNEQYPLELGWEERIPYYNLYPLLVHLNLFGSGYLSSVRQIIKKF